MNKQKTSEENAKEKLFELEDARLMKQLLKAEAHRNVQRIFDNKIIITINFSQK